MTFLQKIEQCIKWNKSIEEQRVNLSQFDNITKSELEELTRAFKSTEAGILIEYLGPEKLKYFLPKFLEFLQDMNWPAAGGASNMLIKAGKLIIPEIRRVFKEVRNDEIWFYWILVGVIRHWEQELIEELKPELLDLIWKADKDGASIQALSILKEENLLSELEIDSYYNYLLKKYEGDNYWINDLKEEIKQKD